MRSLSSEMCLCKWREGKGDKLRTSGGFLSSELKEYISVTLFIFFKKRAKYSVR